MMKIFGISLIDFKPLDLQIDKMKELRDSYRSANIEHYGEFLAQMLDN